MDRTRVVFLDVLRFVAAFSVLAQHTIETNPSLTFPWLRFWSAGVFGVVLFFAISGFVIPMTSEGRFDLRRFAVRRVFRIFPLVAATLLLFAVVERVTGAPEFRQAATNDPSVWLANLLLIQDYVGKPAIDGVTWTLSIELVWYGLYAIGFWRFGRRFDRLFIWVAPALMLALSAVSVALDHRLPLGRIGLIYVAILGCRGYRCVAGQITPGVFTRDLLLFLSTTWMSNWVAFGYFIHPNITLTEAIAPWTTAPLLFSFVCLSPWVRRTAVLESRTLGWLGSISYSTYLLHPVALGFALWLLPIAWVPPAVIAATLVLSWAGFRLVEKPGQDLGRRVSTSIVPATQLS